MEKQTGISLLVKIESSYLNCRSSAVRPHLGARIDAILSGFSSTHLTPTRLCSFPAYGQSVLHVPFAVQAACHGEPSVVCRPPRQNLCKSHSGLSLSASNKRWQGEKLIEEARKETQSASIPASRFYGVWKDEDFPEVHYLVVGLAGSATSVQFIEEEVPVKGYVDVFAETVYESPAFAEAGAAFEVHVRGCRQFEYALEYGCHPPVLFD